jgi:hypothetical protein
MASGTTSAQTVSEAITSKRSQEALYLGSHSTMGKKDLSVRFSFVGVIVVVVILTSSLKAIIHGYYFVSWHSASGRQRVNGKCLSHYSLTFVC